MGMKSHLSAEDTTYLMIVLTCAMADKLPEDEVIDSMLFNPLLSRLTNLPLLFPDEQL